jgi:AmmeMemoRadiSam system protein A
MSPEDDRGRVLIDIAREGIADVDGFARRKPRSEAWLAQPAATFVTLRLDGDLRGCIGSLEAVRRLGEDVYANARAAAYRDPRFAPVSARERDALEVEVSVLSAPQPLAVESESEALERLRPGVDGVILRYEHFQATFLPQVWENIPDPLVFLSELRLKARLPARFWHPRLHLARYTVEKFR